MEIGIANNVLPVPMAVGLLAVAVASITDLWKFKVHNLLTLPVLISGLVFSAVTGGWAGLGWGLLGGWFGFTILFLFYMSGGMGAGDVKLMAALGTWLGPVATAHLFVFSALAAGIYALILILIFGRAVETWNHFRGVCYRVATLGRYVGSEDRVEGSVNASDRRRRVIPFAAMMGLGLLALLTWHWVLGSR